MNVERHKKAWLINILRRCGVALAFVPAAIHPCEAQHPIPTASNACAPIIQVTHATISCFDLKNSEKIQIPTIDSPCGGAITSLTYQDTYYELATRKIPGFAGYFDMARWEKISGDGGVDVTGAPNGILVEGANIAKVSVAPQMETILRIVIPAEGYATFDWTNIGGSNLYLETQVNTKSYTVRTKGFYRTPLLRLGDTLTLHFKSAEASEIKLSNFNFITNAIGVTERQWTAIDKAGARFSFHQYIAVKRSPISNIIFPGNLNSADAMAAPNLMGFPVLDEDGDFRTIDDQRILDKNDCGFDVSWKDSVSGAMLTRHWIIKDVYSGSILEHTQDIQTASDVMPEVNAKGIVPTTRTKSNSNADNKSVFVANFGNEGTDSF